MRTADRARGKWRGILNALGVDSRYLSQKHGPCPFCEGKDRFRWDNKDGGGSFFCSHCGAGDGIEFVKRFKGWDFKTAVREIDALVGGCSVEPIRKPQDERERKRRLNTLWLESTPLDGKDPASAYLASRGVLHSASCLRYHPHCPKPHGEGYGPAMLALVVGAEGEAANIHRTFLEAPKPGEKRLRATMAGSLPDGCAVRLFGVDGDRIGIAEGIETAIAAAKRFRLPVWSALNSTLLAKWTPPDGVTEVVVFGDCDRSFGGQAAAFNLAHRLSTRFRIRVDVRIPQATGKDWADADAA